MREFDTVIHRNIPADDDRADAGPAAAGGATVRPRAASVQRVLEHLHADPIGSSLDKLATVARITLPRLRRNVRCYTGNTLARLVLEARLRWAHDRLQRHDESRSLAQFAEITGHASAAAFSRAYQRCFHETPTQTRARAFVSPQAGG